VVGWSIELFRTQGKRWLQFVSFEC